MELGIRDLGILTFRDLGILGFNDLEYRELGFRVIIYLDFGLDIRDFSI